MRTITITMRDGNDFDVAEDDRSVTRLCWDEMVGQIASMTHPMINKPRYPMLTEDERAERDRLHQERLAEIAAAQEPQP